MEVTTGEILISGISLKVEDGILKIDNLNSCFWAKGYERPLVPIQNSNLKHILQHGYGTIFNTDTLVMNTLVYKLKMPLEQLI